MFASPSLPDPHPLPESRAGRCAITRQRLAPAPGTGQVEIAAVDGCSAVVSCLASSPLQLLAPRPRGRAAWVVVASHGGGLVPGDAIALDVALGPGATACLGTQAETKVYRQTAAGGASHRLAAAVGAGGLLAVLPDPVSPFGGSRYEQQQRFELAEGASLVVLDAVTAGRSARGERWAFAGYRARNEVRAAGALLLADAIRLEAGCGPPVARRLAGAQLLATVILVGPRVAAAAWEMLERIASAPASGDAPVLAAASPLADGALLRIAAWSVEGGLAAVRSHLGFLATLLDGDPLLRRP
jgi:urease accessory protein